eukprot:CFRG5010T1
MTTSKSIERVSATLDVAPSDVEPAEIGVSGMSPAEMERNRSSIVSIEMSPAEIGQDPATAVDVPQDDAAKKTGSAIANILSIVPIKRSDIPTSGAIPSHSSHNDSAKINSINRRERLSALISSRYSWLQAIIGYPVLFGITALLYYLSMKEVGDYETYVDALRADPTNKLGYIYMLAITANISTLVMILLLIFFFAMFWDEAEVRSRHHGFIMHYCLAALCGSAFGMVNAAVLLERTSIKGFREDDGRVEVVYLGWYLIPFLTWLFMVDNFSFIIVRVLSRTFGNELLVNIDVQGAYFRNHENAKGLLDILQNLETRELFVRYAQKRHCLEQVEFLLAVQNCTLATATEDRNSVEIQVKEIVDLYVRIDSEKEVNLPQIVRERLLAKVDDNNYREVTSLFEEAFDEISCLVSHNLLLTFLGIPEYRAYAEKQNDQNKLLMSLYHAHLVHSRDNVMASMSGTASMSRTRRKSRDVSLYTASEK